MKQKNLSVETSGRGLYEITNLLNGIVDEFDVPAGLAHLFLQHTSASLIIFYRTGISIICVDIFLYIYIVNKSI